MGRGPVERDVLSVSHEEICAERVNGDGMAAQFDTHRPGRVQNGLKIYLRIIGGSE